VLAAEVPAGKEPAEVKAIHTTRQVFDGELIEEGEFGPVGGMIAAGRVAAPGASAVGQRPVEAAGGPATIHSNRTSFPAAEKAPTCIR